MECLWSAYGVSRKCLEEECEAVEGRHQRDGGSDMEVGSVRVHVEAEELEEAAAHRVEARVGRDAAPTKAVGGRIIGAHTLRSSRRHVTALSAESQRPGGPSGQVGS